MKRIAVFAAVAVVAVSCSSYDSDEPVYSPRAAGGSFATNLDMLLPPSDWWHQPMLADAVKLSADQMTALDKIAQDQGNDVRRIENDMTIAVRDLRALLDSNQPSQNDIIAAGQRIRQMRDSLFDRQLQMLAAERTVLTRDQWQTLQDQLRERRQQRNREGYPRRGGRGMGGRGRWPGY
jgi:Spy/CpxP family protein refolding chaperone